MPAKYVCWPFCSQFPDQIMSKYENSDGQTIMQVLAPDMNKKTLVLFSNHLMVQPKYKRLPEFLALWQGVKRKQEATELTNRIIQTTFQYLDDGETNRLGLIVAKYHHCHHFLANANSNNNLIPKMHTKLSCTL